MSLFVRYRPYDRGSMVLGSEKDRIVRGKSPTMGVDSVGSTEDLPFFLLPPVRERKFPHWVFSVNREVDYDITGLRTIHWCDSVSPPTLHIKNINIMGQYTYRLWTMTPSVLLPKPQKHVLSILVLLFCRRFPPTYKTY